METEDYVHNGLGGWTQTVSETRTTSLDKFRPGLIFCWKTQGSGGGGNSF